MSDTRLRDATWRKSTYSGSGNACVEVANAVTAVGVRDTKNREGGALVVSRRAWTEFVRSAARR